MTMPNPSDKLSEGEGVATCEHGVRHPWACDECDREALERLHAAAPDLAEACRLALAFLDDPDGGTDTQYREAKASVSAALSRLTPSKE